jgi:hypothetical protein
MIGLVAIGTKRDDHGLAGDLADCHQRIRDAVKLAIAVAEAPQLDDVVVKDIALQLHRFFSKTYREHAAEEDELISPLLEGRSAGMDRALEEMHATHVTYRGCMTSFLLACHTLVQSPSCRWALLPHALLLNAVLLPHLDLEERVMFPTLRALPASTQARVLRALHQRRQASTKR